MKILTLLALTFCLALLSFAAPPEMSAPARLAYDELHQTEVFALGGVGFAGTTSPSETAFRELAREPNASAVFIALLDDETTTKAGQLYALLGLKEAKSAQFEERLPAFLSDESLVSQMRGCLLMPVKVQQIAARFAREDAARA